jgi:hypothetical protein
VAFFVACAVGEAPVAAILPSMSMPQSPAPDTPAIMDPCGKEVELIKVATLLLS